MSVSTPTVTLEPVGSDTVAYVETLLERADLPARDVRSHPEWFYVGRDGGNRIGVGGIEAYGAVGLLRSVVVERDVRGTGYGNALCEALEARARRDGVETLYLLTTTAPAFFAGRGYVRIDRAGAPVAIRETDEFSDLCPATATCLRKEL